MSTSVDQQLRVQPLMRALHLARALGASLALLAATLTMPARPAQADPSTGGAAASAPTATAATPMASAMPSAAPASAAGAQTTETQAQTAPRRNPKSANGQATAAPQQFNGLLGNLGGARTKLAADGFTFNGHIVSEFAGNATGGIVNGGPNVGGSTNNVLGTALSTEVGLGFDWDLGKRTNSGAGIIHALFTTRFGSSLSSNVLGNLISVQEIYGDGQTTRITYFDYEQLLDHKKLSIELGKINQQNDFIAGPSYWGGNLYCFYENNAICGTPAGIPVNNGVTPAGSAGYNYYPSSMLGVRVKGSPTKSFYIEAAALQVNPIVNTYHGGFYLGLYGDTGTELPAEVGITLRNRSGDAIGDVRFGGYYDTSNVFDDTNRLSSLTIANDPSNAAALATLPTQYVRGRSGYDIQFDHLLDGSSRPDRPGTAAFLNAEYSDPNTALLTSFIDAGVVRHGTFRRRPDDTVAFGFATSNFNPRLQKLELALESAGYTVPFTDAETALELNYGIQATKWLVIRPGLQYIANPKGEESNVPFGLNVPRDALVFGLATDISF